MYICCMPGDSFLSMLYIIPFHHPCIYVRTCLQVEKGNQQNAQAKQARPSSECRILVCVMGTAHTVTFYVILYAYKKFLQACSPKYAGHLCLSKILDVVNVGQ